MRRIEGQINLITELPCFVAFAATNSHGFPAASKSSEFLIWKNGNDVKFSSKLQLINKGLVMRLLV